MQINLKRVSGSGFLTFYDPFDFQISEYEGKTLQIDGWNKDDEMSKSNGSGKSSLLEAIGWGLYGELCRKSRYKDEVIYNRNGVKAKKAIVSINFEIGNNVYSIERTVEWKKSPELIIWQNSEVAWGGTAPTYQTKQTWLEGILGMNFVSFQCCQMFGRDFMSFPELKPSERAKTLTDIRGLEKYVKASKNCGDNVKDLQATITYKNEELKTLEGRIAQLREIDYRTEIKKFEEDREGRIKDIESKMEITKRDIKKLEEENKKVIKLCEEEIISYEGKIKQNKKELSKRVEIDRKDKELGEKLLGIHGKNELAKKKYQDSVQESINIQRLNVGVCPTCKQKITGEHLRKELSKYQAEAAVSGEEVSELSLQIERILKERKVIEKEQARFTTIEGENEELAEEINNAKTAILRLQNDPKAQTLASTLENLKDALQGQKTAKNPYVLHEEERKKTTLTLVTQSKVKKAEIEEENTNIAYQQFWVEGFKKIRMMLFSTMIDRLQDHAQNLLSQYSSELQIKFNTERETRSGTLKDEFNIEVTDGSGTALSYEMYSGGERQKVRLIISMALAEMIKEDCGREFNFLCFDEPNDSLDEIGKDVNFEVFTKLAGEGKAVLVTDHDAMFKDKFDHSITVIKESNKSRIEE